jgi:5,10-methenyltetrahydromethanopterin hydrogenase
MTAYFKEKYLKMKYPPELEVKETTDTASSASFLDLYLEFDDSGQLSTKIYDKRDDERENSIPQHTYTLPLTLKD